MLKQKYFLTGIFILSAERQPIKLAWRKIVWLHPSQPGVHFRRGEVHIEDDVFIGLNVCICSSVTIGKGAIIGAGSVVTKDIPPYQVWAGNPARYIKDRAK